MGCGGGSSHATLPLDVVVTYPHKDTVAEIVKPQQNSYVPQTETTVLSQVMQPETKESESTEPDDKSPRSEEPAIAVECLHAYVQHERRIHQLERRRALQCYQIKLDQLRQLEVAATNLENERQRLAQKMAAVNSLFNEGEAMTVRNELLRQKEGDGVLHPDQEEYLDDLNRMVTNAH
ncbi:hypothetical protein MRX96_052741 [Rhipicephalus microplus]